MRRRGSGPRSRALGAEVAGRGASINPLRRAPPLLGLSSMPLPPPQPSPFSLAALSPAGIEGSLVMGIQRGSLRFLRPGGPSLRADLTAAAATRWRTLPTHSPQPAPCVNKRATSNAKTRPAESEELSGYDYDSRGGVRNLAWALRVADPDQGACKASYLGPAAPSASGIHSAPAALTPTASRRRATDRAAKRRHAAPPFHRAWRALCRAAVGATPATPGPCRFRPRRRLARWRRAARSTARGPLSLQPGCGPAPASGPVMCALA